jgi:hypothetical protein
MKYNYLTGGVMTLLILGLMTASLKLNAQDEESSSPFSVGGDLVSSYLWRGTKFGTGPAIQPYVELGLGNFAIGGWGSYCFTTNEAAEADLYLSYGFDFGLSIGMTDYYFPGSEYFDYSTATGSHAFEINLGYETGGLSLAANYFLNEAGGAGTMGGDMYFEAGYSFGSFGFVLGAGNGWHTMEADADESDFNVCNIGVTASKDIKVTDSFSLPVNGALILNPDTEQFHVVVGISF